jgi:hypothetical protein
MTPPNVPNTSVIIERLEGLRCDMAEIKESTLSNGQRFAEFQLRYTERHEQLKSSVDAAWKKINEHAGELADLKKLMSGVEQTNQLLKWLSGIFTALLIAILVMFITGKATLIFR